MPPIPLRRPQAMDIEPHWQTEDGQSVRLYQGHVYDVLRGLPSQSVHCTITSPPYWNLRDYQTAPVAWPEVTYRPMHDCQEVTVPATSCSYGLEKSPAAFVAHTVLIFRELRRVMRDDGTLWLNFGDSYSSGNGGDQTKSTKQMSNRGTMIAPRDGCRDVPNGNLLGIPWRVAFAMQADGWILRQDVIWAKPSCMPESITSRCTKSHEYIFMFAKRMGYYFDHHAIREESVGVWNSHKAFGIPRAKLDANDDQRQELMDRQRTQFDYTTKRTDEDQTGRNKRSVWTVNSKGYAGAHFAVFGEDLIRPCILAGTSERGCCARCGVPWVRDVETSYVPLGGNSQVKTNGVNSRRPDDPNHLLKGSTRPQEMRLGRARRIDKLGGWRPGCQCGTGAEPVPCLVLDPFCGTATTCCLSLSLGRRSIGIDLSRKYLDENAVPRVTGRLRTLGRAELIPHARRAPVRVGTRAAGKS